MIGYSEDMPGNWEKSANREPRKVAPKPRESLDRGSWASANSQKKVDYITSKWKLRGAREKLKKAKEDTKASKTNKANAGEELKDDLNVWVMPGEVPDDGKAEVDSESPDLKKLEESIEEQEKAYQIHFDQVLDEEKKLINDSDYDDKEVRIAKIEREYIEKYSSDMVVSEKPLNPQYFADKFPSAWKETLLNPESTKNTELQKVRDKMLKKVSEESQKIPKTPWESDSQYNEKLLKNFNENTGLNISQAEFEKFMWITTEAGNTGVPTSYPPTAPAQSGATESSNSWVTNASQQRPAQSSSGGWSGNNSSGGSYSSSGGWGGGWSGGWGGYSSGGSSTGGGWSSSWSSSAPSERGWGGQEANINYAGWNKAIMDYALAKQRAGDIMGAAHCTDWVVKVFKNAIWASLYDLPKSYDWVAKISGWTGLWGTPAGPDKIASIVWGKHVIVDKPPYWSWKTHSFITLWTPEDGLVKVVSYPNGGIPPKLETYDLFWRWRWDKDGKVLRIQWV